MHNSIPIASRLSICTFATLVRELEAEGVHLRSKSDVVWRVVEQMTYAYCRKHETTPFDNVRDALSYLDTVGLPLDTNKRTAIDIAKAEADNAYYLEAGSEVGRRVTRASLKGSPGVTLTRSIDSMSKEELEAAARRIAGQMIETGVIQVESTVSDNSQPFDVAAYTEKEARKKADIKAALSMRPVAVASEPTDE